jgi:hypothetical protein
MRELEVFRRVMELGTITAAAEVLHISQPAVSRTLQQAERRLGFPLFLRRKKRLLATAEAQSLFPETVSAFAAFAVPIIATPMIAKPVSDTLDALSAARSTQVRCCGTADIDHLQFDACF